MNATLRIGASIEQLDTLCRTVEGLQPQLQCSDRQMFEIMLVLEELVANAIRHGGCTRVEVELVKEWDELVITIRDDGRPFDPTMVAPVDCARSLAERKVGGLGIHLVHHYTDSFDYRREGQDNIITLTKSI
jgi:anti-sigma regulatory factor (Ser/Thr protein kinase)